MKLTFLGTGTSHGIPVIGCNCSVCTSSDPKDNRMRCSAIVYGDNNESILIDCSPEFRIQALRESITAITAVLLTHSHADHLHGLDDLRIFCKPQHVHTDYSLSSSKTEPVLMSSIPIYSNAATIHDMRKRFSYVFTKTQEGGGKPHFTTYHAVRPVTIGSITCTPLPILHGHLPVCGWRIGNTAYVTDCSSIPETTYEMLTGITTVVIDGLRIRKHSTHFSFKEAVAEIAKIAPKAAYITHICHDISHKDLCQWLQNEKQKYPVLAKTTVLPAYDGLSIEI